jgi:riboflavin transporter FmnP
MSIIFKRLIYSVENNIGVNQTNRSKKIAILALFSALAIVMRLSPFKFPAPFAPYLKFELWEVPIVLGLLFYGPSIGFGSALTVLVVGTAVQVGPLPVGQIYNYIAFTSMMIGIVSIQLLIKRMNNKGSNWIRISFATLGGIIFRVAVMAPLMAFLLPMPYPLGFSIPEPAMPATILSIILFNSMVAGYTIPVAYIIAEAVAKRTKLLTWTAVVARL